MTTKVYKNARRLGTNGSQSELPQVSCTGGKCTVSGYQRYSLTKTQLTLPNHYRNKFQYIKNFLQAHVNVCTSISDIGASNGIVVFSAAQAGYSKIYALDHDLQCIKLLNTVKSHLGFDNIVSKSYSFGDTHVKTDIVIAGALIHWIYSCTALYGNFDQISSYLHSLANKYLIIEWVNPNDLAIKAFKHTSFNKSIIKEPYNKENFLASLKKYFGTVEKVLSVHATRELYLCTVSE